MDGLDLLVLRQKTIQPCRCWFCFYDSTISLFATDERSGRGTSGGRTRGITRGQDKRDRCLWSILVLEVLPVDDTVYLFFKPMTNFQHEIPRSHTRRPSHRTLDPSMVTGHILGQ